MTEEWKRSSSWKVQLQRNATMKKSHILILLVLVGESARMELIATVPDTFSTEVACAGN